MTCLVFSIAASVVNLIFLAYVLDIYIRNISLQDPRSPWLMRSTDGGDRHPGSLPSRSCSGLRCIVKSRVGWREGFCREEGKNREGGKLKVGKGKRERREKGRKKEKRVGRNWEEKERKREKKDEREKEGRRLN